MSTIMTNGHLAWFAGPDSAISESHWVSGPTLAELSTLENYSAAVKVDGTDFNAEASEQVDDRSFADQAGAQSRGVAQASGNIEIYTPGKNDTTSIHAQAWDTFATPRTRLALLNRPIEPQANALAAGDEVNIFRVITDETQHNRNDASRTLGIGLKIQDNALVNYIVPASTPTAVAITPAGPLALGVGDLIFLEAAYQGRNVTVGAIYSSSNEEIFTVTANGIVIGVAVGSATLTVTTPGSAAGTPITVTVSA